MKNFGVNAKVSQIKIGPAVTQYEIQPAMGVKVSRIVNLHNDIALALAAKDIRIEAPIPGKSAVGIEVPNQTISMVTLREVIEASPVTDNKLKVVLGRDISVMPLLQNWIKCRIYLLQAQQGVVSLYVSMELLRVY